MLVFIFLARHLSLKLQTDPGHMKFIESQNINDTDSSAPKYDYSVPGHGAHMVWQRPRGEVKGIFLWLHGCGGRATNMFTKTGYDGHYLTGCDAPCSDGASWEQNCCPTMKEELQIRKKARSRGFLVVAMQGGHMQRERCFHKVDVRRIAISLANLKLRENVTGKPVIIAGFSAGGCVATLVTAAVKGSCTVMVSATSRENGDRRGALAFPADYPDSPIMYIHHDNSHNSEYKRSIILAKNKQLMTAELCVDWAGKSDMHHNYMGAYTNEALDFCETGKQPEVKNFDH